MVYIIYYIPFGAVGSYSPFRGL